MDAQLSTGHLHRFATSGPASTGFTIDPITESHRAHPGLARPI
jgi:hypothetical protein